MSELGKPSREEQIGEAIREAFGAMVTLFPDTQTFAHCVDRAAKAVAALPVEREVEQEQRSYKLGDPTPYPHVPDPPAESPVERTGKVEITDEMVERGGNAIAEAQAWDDEQVAVEIEQNGWEQVLARVALVAALGKVENE